MGWIWDTVEDYVDGMDTDAIEDYVDGMDMRCY
jgi:hypothetical protein